MSRVHWNLTKLLWSISMLGTGDRLPSSGTTYNTPSFFTGPCVILVLCVSAQNGSISARYSLIKYIQNWWQGFLTIFSCNYFAQRLYKTLFYVSAVRPRKGEERRELLAQFLEHFLTTAFHSLSLCGTAASPPFRSSPRALAALGRTVHPRSPRQNVGTPSMGQAPLVTPDRESI